MSAPRIIPANETTRIAAIERARKDLAKIGETYEPPADGFTCDQCTGAPACPYAFDNYNTNGDCLAEK